MKNADQPINNIEGSHQGINPKQCIGLTKREYFAGLAMQGLLASCDWNISKVDDILIKLTGEYSVKISDELLKQLEK